MGPLLVPAILYHKRILTKTNVMNQYLQKSQFMPLIKYKLTIFSEEPKNGAADGTRTHDVKLGKLAFYH